MQFKQRGLNSILYNKSDTFSHCLHHIKTVKYTLLLIHSDKSDLNVWHLNINGRVQTSEKIVNPDLTCLDGKPLKRKP
jgi:hypothetical protein